MSSALAIGQGANAPREIVNLDAKRLPQMPTFDQTKVAIRQQLQALALKKAAARFSDDLLKNAMVQQ